MAITWDNVNKVFDVVPEVGLGDSWSTAFKEDDFVDVVGQSGVIKPVSIPGLQVYQWIARIEMQDAAYVLWKNSLHLIEVVSENDNKRFFEGYGTCYLGWGEKINGNPQNGCSFFIDDTNYFINHFVRMATDSLSVTNFYSCLLKTLRRNDTLTTKYAFSLRHLEGELLDIKVEGFRTGFYITGLNNNIIVDNLQVTDSGLIYGGFHHMAEMTTPVKNVVIKNCQKGIEGHGEKTPNIDIWNTQVYDSISSSVSTIFSAEITLRVIDSINSFSPLHIETNSVPQAIEECNSFKIKSNSYAKIYLEDGAGLNALQIYSGSKLIGDTDNSQILIEVDNGTDFAIGEIMKVNMEHMLITGISSNQLTVEREYNSTTASAHGNGMWIWKVPNYLILNSNGNISVLQPEGIKDYIIFPKRRWDTTALILTSFTDHVLRIEKEGFGLCKFVITEYPTEAKGIMRELYLTPIKVNVDQEVFA